ncbi:MAG: hypothetical protein WAW73_09700 [Rhodoferax sp.]
MSYPANTVAAHFAPTVATQTIKLFCRRAVSTVATACLASAAILFTVTAPVSAQEKPAQEQRLLTDSEVKAKYQNCEGGWYSGPRPGKARYAKDPWLWVVTPAFAQKYCMPPEFVSAELKGAEAVAFRLLSKGDDENCGFGGNPNVCSREVVLRFDVYIKSDVKLPKAHEGRYYQSSILPSAKLIGNAPRQWEFLREQTRRKPEPALKPHFDGHQVGIEGIKDGKVAWPIVSLFEQTHFGGIFEGIDYYAFEGSAGFFENPGIKQNNVSKFVISFLPKGFKYDGPNIKGISTTSFSHVIEFPESFTDKISEADRTRGRNVADLARRAFAPSELGGAPAKP